MNDILTKLIGIRDFYPDGNKVDRLVERAIAALQDGTIGDDLRADIADLETELGDCTVVRLLSAI
jgi:hypothetical protein